MKIELDELTFWLIYDALHDAESTLWRCDGATNPEDEDLVDEIAETVDTIQIALEKIMPIVEAIKNK